ncbi:hypothetical protein GT347_20400 [Xylophilus rhododendri]|uniref:Uncharacterized protein n=1 Tax=Xylophilus rhododendri TaxID=2697032 RepID=A0A857JA93_9BURK|nr:hypothetical protein [Xylophilus rhododendri]QHJ00134.1 hypothetical protein GT347_20400 [Xylophilus rhododendri]
MLFVVYQTRHHGRPLAPERIAASPRKGLVRFGQGTRDLYARGVMLARLLDPADRKTELIPPIEQARVHRVFDFLQIIGIEHYRASAKAKVDRWDQTWICCQDEAQGHELMLRMHQRIREGYRPHLTWVDSPVQRLRRDERAERENAAFQAEFANDDPPDIFK